MQDSTSLAPLVARKTALQQGLRFGTLAGCVALLSTTVAGLLPVSAFSVNVLALLAFIAFFVAGHRTAKKTNRIDMGALAGFWAGVVVAFFGPITFLVFAFAEYHNRSLSRSSLVYAALNSITPALLALLFGTVIGALGGFIGKIYAETAVVPSVSPPQSAVSIAPSVPPVPPTPSPDAQQHKAEE